MRMRHLSLLILPVLALGACADDPEEVSTAEVQQRTDAVIHSAVSNAFSSLQAFADLETFASLGNAFSSLDGAFSNLPAFFPTDEDDFAEPPRDAGELEESGEVSPEQLADAASEWLSTYVFTDANLESQDGDSATYLLRGAAVCVATTTCTYAECDWDANPSCVPQECVEEVDPACLDAIDALELRVRATLVGTTGVDIDLLVGPERVAPAHLELRESGIAYEVDLGEGKAAVEHILSVTDADEEVELPSIMVGRVRGALTVHGEEDVSLSYSIVEAINIVASIPEGTLAVSAEARDPALSVRAQGALQALTFDVDLGAIDVAVPYAALAEATDDAEGDEAPEVGEGSLSFHLDGLTGSLTVAEGDEALFFEGLSLGDGASYLRKDSTTLVELNLNSELDRAFALAVTPFEDSAVFGVAPGFVLTALFNLQAVDGAWGEIESFLLDETYTVSLTGAAGGAILPLAGNGVDFDGGLKVQTGTLSLSSTAGASVSVAQGDCLVGIADDELAPEAHPLLGWFTSAACPE